MTGGEPSSRLESVGWCAGLSNAVDHCITGKTTDMLQTAYDMPNVTVYLLFVG